MFVLPRFAGLFETLDVPLPPTTAALMWISNALRHYWWLIGAGVIGGVFGLVHYLRTEAGKATRDTVMIRLPILGPIVRNFIVARVIRLFGVLMDSYVPLLDVLALTRDAAGNGHYRALLTRAADAVEQGEPISAAFDDPALVTPSVAEAIRSGESTGRLSEMLLNMADFLDEENDVMLRALTSILEPIILIVH
jgi:type II secretory pathway component PulF